MRKLKKLFTNTLIKKSLFRFVIFMFIIGIIFFSALGEDFKNDFSQMSTPLYILVLIAIMIFFVIHLIIYFNLMQMVKIVFKEMRKDQQAYYTQLLSDEFKRGPREIMVFDDVFVYESGEGYVPVRFDNTKRIIIKKQRNFKINKVSVKLKKGGNPLFSYECPTDVFLELLLMIKAHDENISIKFKRM